MADVNEEDEMARYGIDDATRDILAQGEAASPSPPSNEAVSQIGMSISQAINHALALTGNAQALRNEWNSIFSDVAGNGEITGRSIRVVRRVCPSTPI
jgi:hypothetical protein